MKTLEHLRKLAYDAHRNTSFSPEDRAERIVNDYSEMLEDDLQKLPEHLRDEYRLKFISKLSAWLSAKSRCASSMITGPANFNVRMAEKANNSERKHGEAFFNYREWFFKKIETKERKEKEREQRAKMNLPENTEEIINGVRVVKNHLENRLQLHFDAKPAPEMISKLKAHAFRWSPTNKAWQRILTANAIISANRVLN